jgi:hypothetical protein
MAIVRLCAPVRGASGAAPAGRRLRADPRGNASRQRRGSTGCRARPTRTPRRAPRRTGPPAGNAFERPVRGGIALERCAQSPVPDSISIGSWQSRGDTGNSELAHIGRLEGHIEWTQGGPRSRLGLHGRLTTQPLCGQTPDREHACASFAAAEGRLYARRTPTLICDARRTACSKVVAYP